MRLNTRIRYGLRTMLELGLCKDEKGLLQKEIAENQDLPVKYLDQIISALKVAGLIQNCGGKKSGYRLAKPASDITIYEIYRTFDEDIAIIGCLSDQEFCLKCANCAAQELWGGLNDKIVAYLKNTTLENLVSRQDDIDVHSKNPDMYFI
jgi:Rrf2 family protein